MKFRSDNGRLFDQEEEMRRKKRSSVDVELYDSDHTYDDLLKMEDDAGKGDANIDLKLIAEFMRVSSDTKSAFFRILSLWVTQIRLFVRVLRLCSRCGARSSTRETRKSRLRSRGRLRPTDTHKPGKMVFKVVIKNDVNVSLNF